MLSAVLQRRQRAVRNSQSGGCMKKGIARFLRNEKGQAVIELAVTIPLLLLVLCAIIDFGWIITNKMFLTYSSREGARYGIVHATDSNAEASIAEKVEEVAPSYIKEKITVKVLFSDPYDIRSGDISVQVSCVIKALTPLTGIFTTDQNIPLDSVCVMKVE